MDWKTKTRCDYIYEYKYPKTWESVPHNENDLNYYRAINIVRDIESSTNSNSHLQNGVIFTMSIPLTTASNLAEFINTRVTEIESLYSVTLEVEDTTVGGKPAKMISYSGYLPNNTIYFVESNTYFYEISFSGIGELYDNQKSLLNELISSVNFSPICP